MQLLSKDYRALGYLWRYIRPFRQKFLFLNILSPIYSALTGASFLYIKRLLDEGFLVNNTQEIGITLLILFGIFFAQTLIDLLQTYLQNKTINTITIDIKNRLFDAVISNYRVIRTRQQAGEILSRFYIDTGNFITLINILSLEFIKQLFTLVAIMAVLFYLNWKFALILFLAYPLFILPLIKLGHWLRNLSQHYLQVYGKSNSILYESLYGYLIIKTYNLIDHFKEKYKTSNEKLVNNLLRSTMISKLVGPINDLASFVGLGLILYFSIAQVQSGSLTVGSLVAFLVALMKFYQPAKALFNLYNSIQTAFPGYLRLKSMLESHQDTSTHGEIQKVSFHKHLELKHVTFSYDNQKMILDDVNLKVKKGEKVAVIGRTGAGKSTLISLLLGLIQPGKGDILIDGRKYQELNKDGIFSLFSYISQEPILFNDSIRYNIQLGKLSSSGEELIEASKKAQLHSFISNIQHGYDTIVGDRGDMLSGGERQRITIARALLRNAPIIIFDEATSSLDYETESDIKKEVFKLSADKTLIIITHRLTTLKGVDKVYNIKDGKLLESNWE
ncbi:MAG: ABC transporter ATP-binding protein [Bacteroidia bacterium]|nr:ABC transporter ATP-binding protein [Bacteroidia bacterium]